MCFSMVGQIAYGIIMAICLILTLTSIFTPGWRELKKGLQEDVKNMSVPSRHGIFPFACSMPANETIGTDSRREEYCELWWKHLAQWEKVVIVCMCMAVVAECAALAWNFFTWCACCCKAYLIHPLSPLSFLVVLFLSLAVVVYALNNEDAFKEVEKLSDIKDKMRSEVGYSFWLAVAALVLAVADTVVAGVTVFCGERWC